MRNPFKRRAKAVELTLHELCLTAVDLLDDEVVSLRHDALDVETCLHCAAESLEQINEELAKKSALCGALLAQLRSENEQICKATEANAKLRDQIYGLLYPDVTEIGCGGGVCEIEQKTE